jgi:hypothetical protein
MGSILLYHKKAAKSFALGNLPPCMCHLHPVLAKDENGCVACLGSDPVAQTYGDMLGLNLSTALVPTQDDLYQAMQKGYDMFWTGFLEPIVKNDSKYVSGNMRVSAMPFLRQFCNSS